MWQLNPCWVFFKTILLLPYTAPAQHSLSRCNYDLYGNILCLGSTHIEDYTPLCNTDALTRFWFLWRIIHEVVKMADGDEGRRVQIGRLTSGTLSNGSVSFLCKINIKTSNKSPTPTMAFTGIANAHGPPSQPTAVFLQQKEVTR